ncbi:unnamed protein product [Callosobruchus maculatus]|uniref:Uncharacterized protein n=1 Tax=Callosobruchus maculatus TaxID=64391 RepID=A0A653CQN9_CALMS|nr:unnamed protein product [Callosobruchus maculatus]
MKKLNTSMNKVAALFCFTVITFINVNALNTKPFPKDFKFGVATAAYQIEGGWNEDGKGENIWDHLVHTNPTAVANNDTGDTACDSYHKYKEDVAMLKYLGVSHYRFSLSWTRLLPNGFANKVNQRGVQYYKNLIKELKDNGIQPLVTLYHWEMPQTLQELGGFLNNNFIDWFGDYAELCFKLFGDDVTNWLTFNEPGPICQHGYGLGDLAPLYKSPGIGEYICGKNLVLAHARAWHIYDDLFRSKQKGSVGIVIDSRWFEPETNKTEDIQAAEVMRHFVVVPWGIRKLLKWIKHTFNNPKIMITENGFCDNKDKLLDDDRRINYIKTYLSNIRDAMDKDGVNVVGYTLWSLMDNFEWTLGYTQKFGIYHVDFNSPNRTRTKKKSADYYKKVIATRCLTDM